MKKLVSIITPVFNEEINIPIYFERMNKVLSGLEDRYDFEFVITDNCSEDKTFEILKRYAAQDSRISVYRFSKNFGYQRSIFTGYTKSRGDCAIEFDCDLQDPPELLSEFLSQWEKGYKVVYGIRTTRQEGRVLTWLRQVFYRLLARVSESPLPEDAGDFILMDRDVIEQLKNIRDRNIYIRGEVFSFGFLRKGIKYSRDARLHGDSKFPIRNLIALAIDGFLSQSTLPLKLASYVGAGLSVITILMIFGYVFTRVAGITTLPGFTTTTVLLLASISINSIFIGIMSEYLARIYQSMTNKPFVIIDESIEGKLSVHASVEADELTQMSSETS